MVALIISAAGYLGASIWLLFHMQRRPAARWALALNAWSLALLGVVLLIIQGQPQLAPQISTASAGGAVQFISLGLIASLTLSYLNLPRPWLGITIAAGTALVFAALLAGGVLVAPGATGFDLSFSTPGSVTTVIAFAVGVAGYVAIYALTLGELRRARIPLHANRVLWWLIAVPLVNLGDLFLILGYEPWVSLGLSIRLLGIIGISWAAGTAYLLDIRNVARAGTSTALMMVITAAVLLLGAGGTVFILRLLAGADAILTILGWVIFLALLFQVLRGITERLVSDLILHTSYDTSQIVADLGLRTANLLDVGQLTDAVATVLLRTVDVPRIMLVLLWPDPDGKFVDTQVFVPTGQPMPATIRLPADSLLFQAMHDSAGPLLQYTLDFAPEFSELPHETRAWLQSLGMDTYLPMFDGPNLSAILGIGPRSTGDPYRTRELELFTAIASQTAVTLKNARLFAEQRRLNIEMQELNEALRLSNDHMAQLDAAKADFITIASHELRTPLTQLRGYADIIGTMSERNLLAPAQVESITGSMVEACERLDDVIGKMLDVSTIDVQDLSLNFAEIAIENIVRDAVNPFVEIIQRRKLSLTVRNIRALPPVQADVRRLTQAVSHIVGNAVKFTPDGGQIEISGRHVPRERKQPESVELTFRDTGVGIDPQHHELVFEKFFRVGSTNAHSSGNTKFMGAGPGLGLTIARGVVAAHGGRIWVESLGHDPESLPGSAVVILLPLQPVSILPETYSIDDAAVLGTALTE